MDIKTLERLQKLNQLKLTEEETATLMDFFAQAEKVRQIGLDLPIVSDLAHQLNKCGFNLDVDVFDVEKLGDEICQSLSKI